jgi:hypothetical protein
VCSAALAHLSCFPSHRWSFPCLHCKVLQFSGPFLARILGSVAFWQRTFLFLCFFAKNGFFAGFQEPKMSLARPLQSSLRTCPSLKHQKLGGIVSSQRPQCRHCQLTCLHGRTNLVQRTFGQSSSDDVDNLLIVTSSNFKHKFLEMPSAMLWTHQSRLDLD